MPHQRVTFAVFLFVIAVIPGAAQPRSDATTGGKKPIPSSFDARETAVAAGRPSAGQEESKLLVGRRHAAIQRFIASPENAGRGARIAPNRFGLPKTYFREGRALTAPSNRDPEEIARNFLRVNRALFPFTEPEIEGLRLTVNDVSSGAVFLTFNQTLNGIDVFNGQIKFTLNGAGELVHAGADEIVPQLNLSTRPRLTAAEAVAWAFASAGLVQRAPAALARSDGKAAFRNPRGGRFNPITAELSIFPMTAASARLAYRIFLELDNETWYEILIDADDGSLLYRHNLYVKAMTGMVWLQSPMDTSRRLVTFPDAWMPAAATVTTGNNVDAYLDTNGDDKPDNTTTSSLSNGRASSATQVFDFPYGDGLTGQNPRNFQAAAVTNLFYLINTAHDYYYGLGFDEAAGNFQTNNFGKGGLANDAVLAEAQQSTFADNASFAPTVDGVAPKIRMGIFTRGTTSLTDDLDSAYDGQVVVHEYGHGVSNRLVGGRTSVSCLNGMQSGALGEGWSDYFSISFYNNPVEGAYTTQDAINGFRRHSYEGYQFTYEDVGNEGYELHNDGEIWAAALWDLRKTLGQNITDRLVINGLKSTPCHPSMTDARDGILAADLAVNAGANRAKIWQVFARHGLGFSAAGSDGNRYPGIYYNAAYDQPVDLQPGGNPAILSQPPSALTAAGDQFSYTVTASNPAGGTLAYAVTEGPPGMMIDGTGVLRWTAGFIQQRVKVTVTDGKGGKVVHGFLLTPDTPLSLNSPIIIAGATDDVGYANFTVPSGALILQVTLRGGRGDADLDLFDPDGRNYYSDHVGTNETLSIATPRTGRWRVSATGFASFSGVTLTAALVTPNTLAANTPLSGLSAVRSTETFYKLVVPSGATSLTVSTSGGSGDVDLYLRNGRPAACQASSLVFEPCTADFYSENVGNAESVRVSSPAAGDWYIDLAAFGTYTGVTLNAAVTLPAAALTASVSSLAFNAVVDGAAPAALSLAFSDPSGSAFGWTATGVTTSGGSWLKISQASGTGNASLQVTIDQTGLKIGTYQGAITITAPALAASPLTIPVTLNVTTAPALGVASASLTFNAFTGQNPAAQNLTISNTGGTLNWTAAATTVSGGNWLNVTPASGIGNTTIQVSAAAAALPAGSYSGSITIAAAGAANSPRVVQISLTITTSQGPAIAGGGVVGGGGSTPAVTTISPGGLATIFGSGFAPPGTAHAVQGEDLMGGNLPASLAGTCVHVDGKAGLLTFVSPGQINFQVPAVSLDTLVDVQVIVNCGNGNEARSSSVPVRAAAASPEFLYWVKNADGKDPVVAVNAVTGVYVGAVGLIPSLSFIPAKPGDILTIYGVSFGPTNPSFAPGVPPATTAPTANPPAVTLGPVALSAADVLYAGVSPGISGLYQLNIRLPAELPDGDHPLTLTLGSFKTPGGGFITVRAR